MYNLLRYGICVLGISLAAGATASELTSIQLSGTPIESSAVIPQPKPSEPTWFSGVFDFLKKGDSTPQLNVQIYEDQIIIGAMVEAKRRMGVFGGSISGEKEIGFLTSPHLNTKLKLAYVNKMLMDNKERYAINFDGGELLYFNLTHLIDSSSNKAVKDIHAVVTKSSNGQVLLPSVFEEQIIASTINRAKVVEANHILIKNNQIVLDKKLA